MVHEGVPRVLYEHPIVEYIPLAVTTVATGPLPPAVRIAPAHIYPALHVLHDEPAWRAALAAFRFAFPPPAGLPPLEETLRSARDLTLLALGFRVAGAIYRARKVSLAASMVGPVYQLFTLPRKFFYKPLIEFCAYTTRGARLTETASVVLGLPRRT